MPGKRTQEKVGESEGKAPKKIRKKISLFYVEEMGVCG